MIIKRLTMHNFGVYAGDNTFEFTHSRPIVLVGGMNGRGKTTFLEAILLALYGDNSNAYKESSYVTYGKYLRSYVNRDSWSQDAFVELEFIVNEGTRNEYLIRREWDARMKRTREKITVMENGVYSEFLTENWPMFVENLLPSALSSFYFFDGEKIAELALDETNVQMKESIRSMLGIRVLDVLKNDLGRSLRRNLKKSGSDTSLEELQALQAKKDELAKKLEEMDQEIEACSQETSALKEEIDELRRKYEVKGGNVVEQRQELMQKRADIKNAILQNKNALVEIASGELPLVLVRDLIKSIQMRAEKEYDDFVMQQALPQIEILVGDYLKENKEKTDQSRHLMEYLKTMTEKRSTDAVYQFSEQSLLQLRMLVDHLLDEVKQNAKDLLIEKEQLKKQSDEVESYLTLDINEKELQDTVELLRDREDELIQKSAKAMSLQQSRSAVQTELNARTAEYSRNVEAYLQQVELHDDTERMIKYTNLALKLAEEYSAKLQERKTDILGMTITDCYKKLANKKNLIDRIVMDPRTLDIRYLDENGADVSRNSLSAGENQLMVIAVLWALAICSKKKLPVIIDTPLSRLDSMHRKALVTTYFPQASEQTIILSTDSEIDRTYYELMKDSIGDEFTLNYSEETKSTTIMKGYFQES